jgi:DtxR family Mn-dependent transcriptional regulator
MPTITVENYLKAIYHLGSEGGARVKTKVLAEHMGVALPSVTSMLKGLSDEGLVEYESYRGASLTGEGRRGALRVIRNHRLIELFLVETLGYTWDEVHDEAELLEHAISDRLASRIDAFLAHPRFDPHGDPIPDASGELHLEAREALASVAAPSRVRFERALDQSPDVLRYLTSLGVEPGVVLDVMGFEPFEGPVRITIRGQHVALGLPLARRMLVTPA